MEIPFGNEVIIYNPSDKSFNFERDGTQTKIFHEELKYFVNNLDFKTTYISQIGNVNISVDGDNIRIGCLKNNLDDFLKRFNKLQL